MKKILLLGRWGKTHALAKALIEKSPQETEVYCYMDKPNTGLVSLAADYMLGDMKDNQAIIDYAVSKKVDFAIAVPHMSLSNDISEEMSQRGIPCIGPNRICSRLETDKSFLRWILNKTDPDASPRFHEFKSREDAIDHIGEVDYDFAVKPVGVTEGDGVKVIGIQLKDREEAEDYIQEIFNKNIGGIPEIMIEEKLVGREYTIQAFVSKSGLRGMPATRDYKLLYEGEKGLNTPGMGSISFSDHLLPFLDEEEYRRSLEIMNGVIKYLGEEFGEYYQGCLSGQFIKTSEGIRVIEFNVRPGDSEIMNIIPILQTDFVEICEAILEDRLMDLQIDYEPSATVCKYVVKEGFPNPKGNMIMEIDEEAIRKAGADLFYSCFAVEKNVYKPSPRGVAVTARGKDLHKAYTLCEEMIKNHIKGERIWHRKDIGTEELLRYYD